MYAIRQKSTGFLMPQIKYKRGHTWSEPTQGCIPRVFKRKSDASNSLNRWLKGKTGWYRVKDTNWLPGDYEILTVPCADRIREDMEVVFVRFRVLSLENK